MNEIEKRQVLSELRKARAAHIKWRSYAYAMVAGLDIEDEFAPLEHTECAFGKWYHSAGKDHFGHLDTYAGIDIPHRMLHKLYHKIFEIAREGRFDEAEKEARRLTEFSRQVLEALDLLEQEVKECEISPPSHVNLKSA